MSWRSTARAFPKPQFSHPRSPARRGGAASALRCCSVSALGAAAGFAGTLASGRFDLWVLAVIAAPVLALTLYLTGATLTEALERRAHGCAGACMLHVAAILAWPLTALFTPLSAAIFWIAPLAALSALVLFASCWSGAPRAIYRMAGQGALVAALAAHQGVFVILG